MLIASNQNLMGSAEHIILLTKLVTLINHESSTLPVQSVINTATLASLPAPANQSIVTLLAYISNPSTPLPLLHATTSYLNALLAPGGAITQGDDFIQHFLTAVGAGGIGHAYRATVARGPVPALRSFGMMIVNVCSKYCSVLTSTSLPHPHNGFARTLFYEIAMSVQATPGNGVRCAGLELWLDLNDIGERDGTFKGPLYHELLKVLSSTLAFPGPDSPDDVDEFLEYRRACKDVLQECYRILRIAYLSHMSLLLASNMPDVIEAGLFCITAVATDVCQRARSKALTASISEDKNKTTQWVVEVTKLIVGGGGMGGRCLGGMCRFLGTFSPVYGEVCADGDVFSLLDYLISVVQVESAKSPTDDDDSDDEEEGALVKVACSGIRSIFLNCTNKLTSATGTSAAIDEISKIVKVVVLPPIKLESLLEICEGSTRLCVCMSDSARLSSLERLCTPLLEYVTSGVQTTAALCIQMKRRGSTGMGGSPGQRGGAEAGRMEATMQQLARGLKALGVVVKYLDGCAPGENGVHPLTELLNVMWPLLQQVSSYSPCRQHEDVLRELLQVHERIVGSFGDSPIIETKLGELINVVVQSYEESFNPCTLSFVAVAVEKFGVKNAGVEESFCQLLAHLTTTTCAYVQTRQISNCPNLITAFFDLCQRFLLFCPASLVKCSQFQLIFQFGVACVTQCEGERDSTRAALIFLTQLFGWKQMRALSEETVGALRMHGGIIDAATGAQGAEVVKSCFVGVCGGLPQMLLPPLTDCLYSLVVHVLGADEEGLAVVNTGALELARGWLKGALGTEEVNGGKIGGEKKERVIGSILSLAAGGKRSKVKFRNLIGDVAKVCIEGGEVELAGY